MNKCKCCGITSECTLGWYSTYFCSNSCRLNYLGRLWREYKRAYRTRRL
jgi:hypothetical protein